MWFTSFEPQNLPSAQKSVPSVFVDRYAWLRKRAISDCVHADYDKPWNHSTTFLSNEFADNSAPMLRFVNMNPRSDHIYPSELLLKETTCALRYSWSKLIGDCWEIVLFLVSIVSEVKRTSTTPKSTSSDFINVCHKMTSHFKSNDLDRRTCPSTQDELSISLAVKKEFDSPLWIQNFLRPGYQRSVGPIPHINARQPFPEGWLNPPS